MAGTTNAALNSVSPDRFRLVGKNARKMDAISRPSLSYAQDAWRRLRGNKVAVVSMSLLVVYIMFAIFAPIFSRYDMATQDVNAINMGFSAKHWFGTDSMGRDLFVRVWQGARVSLSIGFAAAMINAVIGAIIGCISGFYGGKLDMFIMRLVDVLYGIPSLIVTMLVMMVLGRGVKCLIIAMCIVGWIGACRFARGEMLRLKNQDFVSAAKVLGVHNRAIIFRHILPNMLGLLITNLTLAVPGAIFNEAFLSFIGLGIAPPNSSWGVLAKDGISMLRSQPMQLFVPSFFICTTMLALNLLGDGLRDAFDPKLRGIE